MKLLGVNKTKKNTPKKPSAKSKVKQSAEKTTKILKSEQNLELQQDKEISTPIKPVRRPSTIQTPKSISAPTINPNIITVTSPQRGTSLLLSNNLPKQQQQDVVFVQQSSQDQQMIQEIVVEPPELSIEDKQTKEDKEINEALQAIMQQNRVSSPTVKSGMFFMS